MKLASNGRYVLNEQGEPIEEPDLIRWAKWLETAERHVAQDHLADEVRVSTVFLGLDHSFGQGPPLLYETMIFGGQHDQYQERYSTREEALEGHKKALAMAMARSAGVAQLEK